MEINEEVRNISDEYNKLIEGLVPGSIPPASRLMKKRESREKFYLKAGRLGMAYTLLIIVFAIASFLLINSIKSDKLLKNDPPLNASIFSTDNPNSFVSAFREVTK